MICKKCKIKYLFTKFFREIKCYHNLDQHNLKYRFTYGKQSYAVMSIGFVDKKYGSVFCNLARY
jgi:hypothetical protein